MLITSILEEIRRDIATFADPGTEVQITERSITWIRSRAEVSVQLVRGATGFPNVLYNGREHSYTSFLASEALADLKDLAATICTTTKPPQNFVPVYAKIETEDESKPLLSEASALVLKQTLDPGSLPIWATRVLFVHGNAGSGKTSTLLHVTRLQAERYIQGLASTLLLYLDAQGKGLSQLEDVMARALQDLRAKFTYHSVAALARRRCVVPIVDGFDELIGPSSAREAFSNLSQFLAQLDCEGALVASSRSAFIDYRTLHESAAALAASSHLSYEIVPVEILPWGEEAIARYCQGRTPGSDELERRVFSLRGSQAWDLVQKPFFLAKISDIIQEGGDIEVGRDVTGQVVEAVLTREASKLRDQRGKELLSPEQHRVFCEALADEMWWLASPELDCETVRLIAQLVAEQYGLGERDAKTLVDRSIAHGLLTMIPGRFPEKRAFEHELFRFEFQAGSLAKQLQTRAATARDYMQRGELPLEVVSRVPFYGAKGTWSIAKVLSDLSAAVASAPNSQFSSTNAGSLAWALIRNRDDLPEGLQFFGLYLRSHDLGSCRLRNAQIRRCIFERVNLEGARIEHCDVNDSQFIACSFGAASRWDGTKVDVSQFFGVSRMGQGVHTDTYDPKEIERVLRESGAVLMGAVEGFEEGTLPEEIQARVRIVERLLTHARTHFYISVEEPWFRNNLASDAAWRSAEELLRKYHLLEGVRLSKSGRPEEFLRLTIAPDKILQARVSAAGEQGVTSAGKFWQELLDGKISALASP